MWHRFATLIVRIAYQYRLRSTASQVALMSNWLELLRRQYNYRLEERFRWWEKNRCDVYACSLMVCHLPELKEQPTYYSQKRDLVNTKALFPEYQEIHSQVLQDCIQRVQRAFDRWITGDRNGKRAGRPRFKGAGRYRSFTFPQMKQDCMRGKFIHLPKIGPVKFIQHRPLPGRASGTESLGFVIKTATVSRKVDGWYVTLSLQAPSVPEWNPDPPTWENTIGIDLSLDAFLVTDEGEAVKVPRYYRRTEKKLRRLQRAVSRKKKGSNCYKKAVRRLAKTHQKLANQRRDFHPKTAHKLLRKGKHIAHEALNIKGLARTRLAKSVHDAGWGQFLQILAAKAERAGLLTIAVDPRGSSQECSGCSQEVPKKLDERWHHCPHCGLSIGRDHNSARVIKSRGVGRPALFAPAARSAKAQEMSCHWAGVTGKPALYVSA